MREINSYDMHISGAVYPSNGQIPGGITESMLWGAGLEFLFTGPFAPAGAASGALGGALQYVIQNAINGGPVPVIMPNFPMGPSWNARLMDFSNTLRAGEVENA